MITTQQSSLRRLRTNLDARQASFLDGISLSAEMVDVAYTRLSEQLWEYSVSDAPPAQIAGVFLDAWSIIDSVHRLWHHLEQMPRLKKNSPLYEVFTRSTKRVSDFRNAIQHLRNELHIMSQQSWPVWGALTWLALLDAEAYQYTTCLLILGRAQSSKQLINPAGKLFRGKIDHVTLRCKDSDVSLSDLYDQVERIIRSIEPSLAEFTVDNPTLAADLCISLLCQGSMSPKQEAHHEAGTDS